MRSFLTKCLAVLVALAALSVIAARLFGPAIMEKRINVAIPVDMSAVSAEARALHPSLTTVMDWHADTLLWDRDINKRASRGLVDAPRLRDGNISIQMFTTVTKSPKGQNVDENTGDSDVITSLAMLEGWPPRTWDSLLERALYQAERLDSMIAESKGGLRWVRSKAELEAALVAQSQARAFDDPMPIAALLGTEGAHPLEGKLENIDRMYGAGFRMMGVTHFFDNELAGSLHGVSKAGLTAFGRAAVKRADELGMIIDLAHVSEAAAWDVLAIVNRPPVVSHTGLRGVCDTNRNFPDDLMKAIAAKGGVIGIMYWETGICDPSPTGIAKALKYGIELVGADHIALGSDWDGAIRGIPSDALPAVTDALIKLGVAEADIRMVMGESSLAYLRAWLPEK